VNYLLDTHTVLWLAENSPELPDRVAKIILDADNALFVSVASAWEVAIKCSVGKLRLSGEVGGFFQILDENGFSILSIKRTHLECLGSLPFVHKDPFDRILVATAITEDMSILSADENIAEYDVRCVW
jgi:PIN domain nuclease of toxin-antitoxin system